MKSLLAIAILLAIGCSSAVKNPTKSEIEPDKVISRIDDLSSRPEWLKESEPFRIEKGFVISTGMTTIPASDRVDVGTEFKEVINHRGNGPMGLCV